VTHLLPSFVTSHNAHNIASILLVLLMSTCWVTSTGLSLSLSL